MAVPARRNCSATHRAGKYLLDKRAEIGMMQTTRADSLLANCKRREGLIGENGLLSQLSPLAHSVRLDEIFPGICKYLPIAWMIDGLYTDHISCDQGKMIDEILHQLELFLPGADDENLQRLLDCLGHLIEIARIFGGTPGTELTRSDMQMRMRRMGLDHFAFRFFRIEMNNVRLDMIDPYDNVVR